jgi:hypothetical protein
MKYLANLDLNKNELQNARIQNLASAPSSPVEGQMYFDTTLHKVQIYQNSAWAEPGGGGGITALSGDVTASGSGSVAATVAFVNGSSAANVHAAELLANAATNLNTASAIVKRDGSGNFSAGTITAALIGNVTGNASGTSATFTGALTGDVTSSGMATTVALVGGASATNVADAVTKRHTQNTDTGTTATTFQLDSGGSGPKLKNSSGELQVRNAADSAFADLRANNIYVNGEVIEVSGANVKLGDQYITLNDNITTNAANSDGGLWVKRLQSDNTTRADAKFVFNNSTGFWQVVDGPVTATVTTNVSRSFAADVGDGTSTTITVTHNLGTKDVTVQVYTKSGNFDTVICDVYRNATNTVQLLFATAPASNAYRVVVQG